MAIKFLSGLNLSNVTAGSILKLDSSGNIVAAVDGTDYNTNSADSWSATGSDIYRNSDVRIGTYQSGVAPAARLHVFDYQTTDPKLLIEDGNTGDASMQFKISTQQYTMGIDNSDSDKFIIANAGGFNLAANTHALEISTAGKVTIPAHTSNGAVRFEMGGYNRLRFNSGIDLLGYTSDHLWVIGNSTTNTINLGADWDWDKQVAISYTPNTVGGAGGVMILGQTEKNNANWTHGTTKLYTNGTERLRIDSNGNVGIGTSTPDSRVHIEASTDGTGSGADAVLHVKQNGGWNANQPWALYVEGYSYLNGFRINASDGIRALHKVDSGGQLGFSVTDTAPITFTQSNSTERMRVHTNGYIGIGTTSPDRQLQVHESTSGTSTAKFTNSTTGEDGDTGFFVGINGSEQPILYGYNNTDMVIGTNGSERMRITNTGNVGIGTASPEEKFHVIGNIKQNDYIIGRGAEHKATTMPDYYKIAQVTIDATYGTSHRIEGAVSYGGDNEKSTKIDFWVSFRSGGNLNVGTPLVRYGYKVENLNVAASNGFESGSVDTAFRVSKTSDTSGGNKVYEIQFSPNDSNYINAQWEIKYSDYGNQGSYPTTVYSTLQTVGTDISDSNILKSQDSTRVDNNTWITQLGVGSSNNTSFDFYNNGNSYFNGNVTVDANLSMTGGGYITTDSNNPLVLRSDVQHDQGSGDAVISFKQSTSELAKIDQDGYMYATGFKTTTASTGFLKADGSVDTSTYASSTHNHNSDYVSQLGGYYDADFNWDGTHDFQDTIKVSGAAATTTNTTALFYGTNGVIEKRTLGSNAFTSYTDHSTQGYLTSYTETDTLDSVTGRGATTTNNISVGNLTAVGGTFTDPVTIYDSTTTENPRLSVGRNAGESIQFDVTDVVNTITAKQDADSNSIHTFVLDRVFGGTGDSVFSIHNDGTPDLTINGSGVVSFNQYNTAGILQVNTSGTISVDTSSYLTSYTETDTLSSVVARGASTTTAITTGGITADYGYFGSTSTAPQVRIYTENASASIADTFTDTTTDKSYIYFNAGTNSNDPAYIMHETSESTSPDERNEGVLHLVPSDDNSTGDYVSIHGTNDPDCIKLHTSGLIETASNYQLQLKSGNASVKVDDTLHVTGRLYVDTLDANTTSTSALVEGGSGEIEARTLGSAAFSTATDFVAVGGDTVTGQITFPTAIANRPVFGEGIIARSDQSDTSGTHDIWGISERYYPSNSTAADAWGIQWSGTPNEINFIGAGQKKLSIDLDTAGTVKIDGNAVATESYVTTQISNLVDSAPAALDTLNELAAALGDDASFSTTMSTALGNRLRIDVSDQNLTATQKSNASTNLGLGTAATSAATDFAAASHTHSAGDITSGTFDSARIPSPSSGDWWNNGCVKVLTDGVMEVGKYMDWHDTDTETDDFSYRMTANSGRMYFSGDIEVDGGDIYITDSNTRLHEGNGNALRVTTDSGYIEMAPMNTSHCHIQTDRSNFYFNTEIRVDSGIIGSYNEDLLLRRAGTTKITCAASTTTIEDNTVINGTLEATAKSFNIEHPTKEGKRLVYGSLEGAEHGVYFRGKGTGEVIELPEHWTGLVHEDSITVQLTPIGKNCVWVEDIKDNAIHVGMDNDTPYFYFIQGERKDIDKLIVEQDA